MFRPMICGIMGGIFSPVCFLSVILSGGMSVDPKKIKTLKHTISTGVICGIMCTLSAFTFWYGMAMRLHNSLPWFFNSASGASFLQAVSPFFEQYILLVMLINIPLSVLGSLFSFGIHTR